MTVLSADEWGRLRDEIAGLHARVQELLEANTREVLRRRDAEQKLRDQEPLAELAARWEWLRGDMPAGEVVKTPLYQRGDTVQVWVNEGDLIQLQFLGEQLRMLHEQPPAADAVEVTAKPDVATLVQRFLAWPLPRSVCADRCASRPDYPHPRYGTSLLSADEARQMVEYLLGDG